MAGDPHDVRAIQAPVVSLDEGGYRVTWRVVSVDGHPVSGSFVFTVGSGGPQPPPPGDLFAGAEDHQGRGASANEIQFAGAALVPALLRGLSLSALLALTGLLGFSSYARHRSARQLRLCDWLAVSAMVLLAGHLIAWLLHVSPANSLDAELVWTTLEDKPGLAELLRFLLAGLAVWALLLARSQRLAFAFSLTAVATGGAIGHPAAIHPLVAIPMKALHLAAVALWLGGILWLSTADLRSADMVAGASRVSRAALLAIVVVGLTGTVQAALFLSAWEDIYRSAYGLTLLGKLAGLLALAAFGAYHRYGVIGRPGMIDGTGIFTRSLRLEVMTMIAVIMLGGFLAYVPTPGVHSNGARQATHGVI
jgi:copper transport protein